MTCCIVTLNDVVSLKLLKSKHIYGSHDVSRASSATEAEDKSDNKATAQNSEKSTEEILKGIYSNKLK